MALSQMWRRLRNFQRWKKATTPMLLNADTGEVDPILQLHRAPDREVDASPSTHAAWEYAASLSRNSAHS